MYDFIDVKPEIECYFEGKLVKKKLVLVFDDFERCGINVVGRLGAINYYTETKSIKTILVADETKIEDVDYKEFKEKLISRTVKLLSDYSDIIRGIVNQYNETVSGYKAFLESNLKTIVQLFYESQAENVRILKMLLIDYERAFSVSIKMGIHGEYMADVLYSFGAILFESRLGNYVKGEYGYLLADGKVKDKYMWFNKNSSNLESLRSWITDGKWDPEDYGNEIRKRFVPNSATDDQIFIAYGVWDLEQKNISLGFPIVIERAYRGDLSCDELIEVLKKIFFLKKNNVVLPCKIDYVEMQKGFDLRKERIYTGEIEEPKRHTFTELNQIESDSHSLYKSIERLDDELYTWKNRDKFVEFLQGSGSVSRYDIRTINLESFDDELLKIVYREYVSSANFKKRELARALCDIRFDDVTVSNASFRKTSEKNFLRLKNMVIEYTKTESDQISLIISRSFIESIDKMLDRLRAVSDS